MTMIWIKKNIKVSFHNHLTSEIHIIILIVFYIKYTRVYITNFLEELKTLENLIFKDGNWLRQEHKYIYIFTIKKNLYFKEENVTFKFCFSFFFF